MFYFFNFHKGRLLFNCELDLFIVVVFRFGGFRRSGFSSSFVPVVLLSILAALFFPPSPVTLSCFILAVTVRRCLGGYSCVCLAFQ